MRWQPATSVQRNCLRSPDSLTPASLHVQRGLRSAANDHGKSHPGSSPRLRRDTRLGPRPLTALDRTFPDSPHSFVSQRRTYGTDNLPLPRVSYQLSMGFRSPVSFKTLVGTFDLRSTTATRHKDVHPCILVPHRLDSSLSEPPIIRPDSPCISTLEEACLSSPLHMPNALSVNSEFSDTCRSAI